MQPMPELQRQLQALQLTILPFRAALPHSPDEINLILLSNFSGRGMQSYACGKDVKAASIHLLVDGGSLLQQSTADEVVTSVAKEMAHVIASHSAEQESCKSLFTLFIGAAGVAAMMCRVSIWRCATLCHAVLCHAAAAKQDSCNCMLDQTQLQTDKNEGLSCSPMHAILLE